MAIISFSHPKGGKDADFSLLNDEKDRLEFLIKNCIK